MYNSRFWNPFRKLEIGFLKFFSSNDLFENPEKKTFVLQQTYLYIAALKLKRVKPIFVKIELPMDSCSHNHSSGLKSLTQQSSYSKTTLQLYRYI